jgi:hypothetical protein
VFHFAESPLRRALKPATEFLVGRIFDAMKKGAAKAAPLRDPL